MYKLPENLESKYKFVTLASKRAEQLQMGAVPKVDVTTAPRKATLIAQEEVATGQVGLYDPDVETPDQEALLLQEEEE